jgi:hypothetical protein
MDHTILLFMSPGDKTKKQKKQRDYKQLTPTKVQRLGEGGGGLFFYRPSYKKVYIYMVACTTRERNVQDINSLEEINICRLCMFVLRNKHFIHPFFLFLYVHDCYGSV